MLDNISLYIILRHLKFLNNVTTNLSCGTVYTIKSVKSNLDHKIIHFQFTWNWENPISANFNICDQLINQLRESSKNYMTKFRK